MFQHKSGFARSTVHLFGGMYSASNQIDPNKGFGVGKSIVLSVVFIIVLNAVIFLNKKLLKRSLNHEKNRTDRSE